MKTLLKKFFRTKSKWISITERLPTDGNFHMCVCYSGLMVPCFFSHDGNWYASTDPQDNRSYRVMGWTENPIITHEEFTQLAEQYRTSGEYQRS